MRLSGALSDDLVTHKSGFSADRMAQVLTVMVAGEVTNNGYHAPANQRLFLADNSASLPPSGVCTRGAPEVLEYSRIF